MKKEEKREDEKRVCACVTEVEGRGGRKSVEGRGGRKEKTKRVRVCEGWGWG